MLRIARRTMWPVAILQTAVLDLSSGSVLDCGVTYSRELNMKKIIVVGFAILAVSTSGALAKGKAKPKAVAAAATTATTNPFLSNVSAADKALYMKNKHDSGMK
jgi:hypothetical protein